MFDYLLASAPDWAVRHAAILIVIVPMLLAPVLVIVPGRRLAWFAAVSAAAAAFYFSLLSLAVVHALDTGVYSYHVGNWPPPIGIEFYIDALSGMILVLLSGMGLLAALIAWPLIEAEYKGEKLALFLCAFLMCLAGLLGVAATGDAFNMFVFLEVSSLATYVLVAMGASKDRRALPAAFDYLIMGTLGASFYVIGLGFLYAATGTLNMQDLASQLPALTDKRSVQVGLAFIVVGLGLKAAMWPLHQWLPNAYAYAPGLVTMFLSATATKVALYALVRWLFAVFSPEQSFEPVILMWVFAPLGMAAMIVCSVQAVFQTDVRRMLAYSSVAQVGYIILGVSLGTAAGVSAGLLHIFNHALLKGALFMAVAAVSLSYGATTLREYAGLGRSAPLTMSAFAIAGLSLIGVPLTAGFISKLQLGYALFEQGWWWAVVVLVVASFLAVIYVGRVLQAVFFEPPLNPRQNRKEAPLLILVPLWALALANIFYGIDANFPASLARDGAAAVLGLEALP